MNLAFVYSGQGSQKVGMGKDFYETSDIFKQVFDLLPSNKQDIAFYGPQEELVKTANTQGILTAFGIGVTEMLNAEGVVANASMGLSLGEYAALYNAKVFSKEQTLDIVNFRASEMTKAAQGVKCKMAAVLKLSKEKIQECCKKAEHKGLVSIANYNCPGQIVISGEEDAVIFAAELCKEAGAKRCVFLETEGAFHTELMNSAYTALVNRFEGEIFNTPAIPVVLNTIAKHESDAQQIKKQLALQVKSSVNFEDSIIHMQNLGIDTVIEIGQGKTLASFINKTVKDITVYNIENIENYKTVVESLKSGKSV